MTVPVPSARGGPLPVVRDAGPGDLGPVLAVYSACIAADPDYLPFLAPGDDAAVLGWFRLKPLAAFLVAEAGGTVAGVAGLRDASPGPGAGQPGGRWLEACRLAVHPEHRGGAVTRDLVRARTCRAVALGGPPVDALRRGLALAPSGAFARLDLVGGCQVRGTCRLPAGRPAGPPALRPAGPPSRLGPWPARRRQPARRAKLKMPARPPA